MKLRLIFLACMAAFSYSASAAYECNTVMGGCPTDANAGTSSHMRSQIVNQVTAADKAATKPVAVENTTSKSKLSGKNSAGGNGLMQVMNKAVLK